LSLSIVKVGTPVPSAKKLAKRPHLVRHLLVSGCNTTHCKAFFNTFILGLFIVELRRLRRLRRWLFLPFQKGSSIEKYTKNYNRRSIKKNLYTLSHFSSPFKRYMNLLSRCKHFNKSSMFRIVNHLTQPVTCSIKVHLDTKSNPL